MTWFTQEKQIFLINENGGKIGVPDLTRSSYQQFLMFHRHNKAKLFQTGRCETAEKHVSVLPIILM